MSQKTLGGVIKQFIADLIELLPGTGAERVLAKSLGQFQGMIDGLERSISKAQQTIMQNVQKAEDAKRRAEQTVSVTTAHNDKLIAISTQANEAKNNLQRLIGQV